MVGFQLMRIFDWPAREREKEKVRVVMGIKRFKSNF